MAYDYIPEATRANETTASALNENFSEYRTILMPYIDGLRQEWVGEGSKEAARLTEKLVM